MSFPPSVPINNMSFNLTAHLKTVVNVICERIGTITEFQEITATCKHGKDLVCKQLAYKLNWANVTWMLGVCKECVGSVSGVSGM